MSDLIRRSDAIEVVAEYIGCDYAREEEAIENATMLIETIPTIEPKRGEWIDAEIPLESGGSMPIQVCNLCKTFYPLAYTGGGHRFCPNCGARMKGVDDETD